MMEEIRQLKADKTKEKGSQHDPKHVADREETLVRGVPRNTEQRFITMAEVATLLEQERAKTPKERFYIRRPPYPPKVFSKSYPERYKLKAFTQYDNRKGSTVEHVRKFSIPLAPMPQTRTYVFKNFQSQCVTGHIPGTLA